MTPQHVMVRRLNAYWQASTPEVREAGAAWYPSARGEVRRLAKLAGCTVARMAAVVAVLSPRVTWRLNLMAAETLVRGHGLLPGLGKNVERARALLNGADIRTTVRGPKVHAFYRALLGKPDAAVVDVWILRAAGVTVRRASPPRRVLERVAAALREGAQQAGVPVAHYQATVWIQVRGKAD